MRSLSTDGITSERIKNTQYISSILYAVVSNSSIVILPLYPTRTICLITNSLAANYREFELFFMNIGV